MKKFLLLIILFNSTIFGTWFEKIPRVLLQPDGIKIECFITGDQYFRRLHDENNYTIIFNNEDGYFYYADKLNGDLIPSNHQVGFINPFSMGIKPGLTIDKDLYYRKKELYDININHGSRDAPTSGQINQVNIFIRFADDPQFSLPRSYYNQIFQNDEGEPSLQHYFSEISDDELYIRTYHYPATTNDVNIAYVDENDRSYYQPYSPNNPNGYTDDQRTAREHALLANAVSFVESDISASIDLDGNNDGLVDGVSFVIYGEPGDWATLLWPHRWALYSEDVFINNVQVYDYMFMLSESWYYNVGVLCHEFGHVLGAPDYYHYDGEGAPTPVGGWDLMASNGNPPQYPSAFTKWKYFDWIDFIPEIIEGGTYTLFPMTQQENVAYKVASPNSDSEYFVLEYRKQDGVYESNLPGIRSGLLVYRVNTEAGNGNAQGPPDELYVYRPGGTLSETGNLDAAPFNAEYGNNIFNESTDPNPFLYNGGTGGAGGLSLYNISQAGESISFSVILGTPEISVSQNELTFNLNNGDIGDEIVTITNIGEQGTILDYSINVFGEAPFESFVGGPDGGNYYWNHSSNETDFVYDWIDISGIGVQLTFNHNDEFSTEPISLPFEFKFFNEIYDYVQVNANGWIGWDSSNETTWLNTEIPSPDSPRPAIFGFFDDLNPANEQGNANSSGNVYYHSNDERVVIWFNNVVRWNVDDWGEYDFQIVLYPDGMFRVNYNEMSGLLNSSTVGFQDENGLVGTEVVFNQNFIGGNFSWIAQSSDGNIPWLYVSTSTGDFNGYLESDQSENIYINIITSDMVAGEYSATMTIQSDQVETITIPIELSLTTIDSTPTLPVFDISSSNFGIIDLPDDSDQIFQNVFDRYSHILTPSGDVIQILAQNEISDESMLHVRGILKSYLNNKSGSFWGDDKTNISNAIASTNSLIFILNDPGMVDNIDFQNLINSGVSGDIIAAEEIIIEGDTNYINNSTLDKTYQKLFQFIFEYGIQYVMPSFLSSIDSAMVHAISNEIYFPLSELSFNQQRLRYATLGLEIYYGHWAHNNENELVGNSEYIYNNRDTLEDGDPLLYAIIDGFFEENLSCKVHLNQSFSDTFRLNFDTNFTYTNKSQYINNVNLSGTEGSSIFANHNDNSILEIWGIIHFLVTEEMIQLMVIVELIKFYIRVL